MKEFKTNSTTYTQLTRDNSRWLVRELREPQTDPLPEPRELRCPCEPSEREVVHRCQTDERRVERPWPVELRETPREHPEDEVLIIQEFRMHLIPNEKRECLAWVLVPVQRW